MRRKIPRSMLKFEVSLVEHCNLKCKMCDHFSPLAKEEYIDEKSYENDIARLAKLFNGQAEHIYLLGGEPLLHPRISDLCFATRKYFRDCTIMLLTNGILLPKMPDTFWNVMVQNRITILITRYPISFDYQKLQDFMEQRGIRYCFAKQTGLQKEMRYNPIDLSGSQDETESYLNCSHANKCITLSNGRLYTCPIAACARHLNQFFQASLPLSNENSINIYDSVTDKDILRFLSKPIPFCRFCAIKQRKPGITWGVSNMAWEEWFL